MFDPLPSGYCLCKGSGLDRSLLLKFLQRTYQELASIGDFSHLAYTVDQYLSKETPIWWVELQTELVPVNSLPLFRTVRHPVACLWLGTAIDQVHGDRHAHIFLLYVAPQHRRRGLGTALVRHAENWARGRGDRQIGLQVFQSNQPALALYLNLGYQAQSLWMVKRFE